MSEKQAKPEVAALGINLVTTLGNARQLTVQTAIAVDASQIEIDDFLDKVSRAADRQASRYEIQGWEAEIETHREALKRAEGDVDNVEVQLQRVLIDLDARAEEYVKRRDEAEGSAREAHVNSGRTGAHKIDARTKQAIAGYDSEVTKILAEKERQTAEAALGRKNFEVNMGRFRVEIARLEAKIAKAKEQYGW